MKYAGLKLGLCLLGLTVLLIQCREKVRSDEAPTNDSRIVEVFGSNIDLFHLENYAHQQVPVYITKNIAPGLQLNDAKTTLGRVLFYDRQLSFDNTISCSSCHLQEFAFGDTALASRGVDGGRTERHAMRLVNARFGDEKRFFWNKRAATLQEQTTQPIKEHLELGYSGQAGRPGFANLLTKLQNLGYYKVLLRFVYGDTVINEQRIQECLSQFVMSIQSFDSKYDVGRSQVNLPTQDFPNFTSQENTGKRLFTNSRLVDGDGKRIGGGLACNSCHRVPEFDIEPVSFNNGVIGKLNAPGNDLNNTRAPSLRDITNASGKVNTPMMHTGQFTTLEAVLDHYNVIPFDPSNSNIDARLFANGKGNYLNLTQQEKDAVVAFLKTLGGSALYRDKKWSNPFIK